MDVNGTRFHLLLGRDDWAACSLSPDDPADTLGRAWDAGAALGDPPDLSYDPRREELTLTPEVFRFKAAAGAGEATLTPDDRRGASRDRFGNTYWIDRTRRGLRVDSSGSRRTTPFWSLDDCGDCDDGRAQAGGFAPVPSAPPAAPPAARLRGLTVTEDHYLVVGVYAEPGAAVATAVGVAGLLIFDLHAGGPPRRALWPAAVPFAPFDLAAAPGGGAWVLDRDHRRAWRLDRHLNVVIPAPAETPPSPADPAAGPSFKPLVPPPPAPARPADFPRVGRITEDASFPLSNTADPVSIEALPDDTILILDVTGGPFSEIRRFDGRGAPLGQAVSTLVFEQRLAPQDLPGFRLVGHDFAFIPAPEGGRDDKGNRAIVGRLTVAAAEGNQSFAFDVSVAPDGQLVLDPVVSYLPMRLFGGKALVTAPPGASAPPSGPSFHVATALFYDFADTWVPLVEQQRPRYQPAATFFTPPGSVADESEAAAGTAEVRPPLDGRQPDCVWHRLLIDACVPPEAEVRVASRAANEIDDLPDAPWRAEPSPYRRGDGSELPFAAPPAAAGPDNGTGSNAFGTYELLFQRARGRYLQLRVELGGTGRNTPRLRAMRVYYPRFSYLDRYLPAVYREEPEPASFLDRFLANFEGLFTAAEDKLAAVQHLFDPRTAPPDALDWLLAWLGVAADPAWTDAGRRLFIRHAMTFFQSRGTVPGLLMALRLATEADPDESIFAPTSARCGPARCRCGPGAQTRARVGAHADTTASASARPASGIRIVEQYRTRQTPAVALGDSTTLDNPGAPAGPLSGARFARWHPDHGGEDLSRRYDLYLRRTGLRPTPPPGTPDALLPTPPFPIAPPSGAEATAWRRFAADTLGFVPSATPDDHPLWSAYLSRRYPRLQDLAAAYGSVPASATTLASVPMPTALPPDGPPLLDWFRFNGTELPMRHAAHRFSVLLPVPRTPGLAGVERDRERARRLNLARRIVELEKPAHTAFDVRFFYALFRVGAARVGFDTLVDRGSRSGELLTPMVLGRGYLAESYLAPSPPWDAADRTVLGRDRLGPRAACPPRARAPAAAPP